MLGTLGALVTALRRFREKNGFVMSSHVAMSMLMALFPFLVFLLALAGQMARDVSAGELIEMTIGGWPDEIAAPIAREVQAVLESSTARLMSLGALFALYFASNGVDAVRVAMTRAYRGEDTRPVWHQRLLNLAFVLGGAALILGAAVLELWVPAYLQLLGERAPRLYRFAVEAQLLRRLVGAALLVFAVAAFHLWLPVHRRRLLHVWPGVGLTLVLWVAAAEGFAFYVARFASYSATYAGLAGAMAALIFLYLMAAILIYGAEVNAVLDEGRDAG